MASSNLFSTKLLKYSHFIKVDVSVYQLQGSEFLVLLMTEHGKCRAQLKRILTFLCHVARFVTFITNLCIYLE